MRTDMKNDFSKGAVWKCIIAQAIPLMIAQLVQLLYNIVDRIYYRGITKESLCLKTSVKSISEQRERTGESKNHK